MRLPRSVRGFSLVEVLVSIAIIGLMMTIYSISSNLVLVNRDTKQRDIALRIAQSKLEDLRATPYASLVSSTTFSSSLLTALASSSASYTVSAYNASTKKIDVSVTWQETNQAMRNVSLTTLITQVGGL